MQNHHSPPNTHHSRPPLFWPIVLVVAAVFFATEHDLTVSLADSYTSSADEMAVAAEGGDTLRRIAFLGLGGLGLVLMLVPLQPVQGRAPSVEGQATQDLCLSTRDPRPATLRALPLALFAAWCGLSLLWSDAPEMTVRRLSVFGCLGVAVLGISRHLTLRDALRAVLLISLAYLLVGVVAELRNGTLRPWSGEFRFAGTLHPNTQALNLAVLCLSSFCLARIAPPLRREGGEGRRITENIGGLTASARRRIVLWSVFAVALLFLVLTKSRTSLAGVLASLGLVATIRMPVGRKAAFALGGIWAVSTVVLVAVVAGYDIEEEFARLALLGREEEAASLTGRIPLWNELAAWAGERPLVGYGFDAFWTPGRIDAVSEELEWGLREAHSAYFDLVLGVGLIGAGLAVCAVLIGMSCAVSKFRASGRAEFAFLFGWLVFCLINGLSESAMTMPMYATFIAALGLVGVTLRSVDRQGSEHSLQDVGRRFRAPADRGFDQSRVEGPGTRARSSIRSAGCLALDPQPSTLDPCPSSPGHPAAPPAHTGDLA